MNVLVWDGSGEKLLGRGELLGYVTVHFWRFPDGSIRSQPNAEEPPTEEFMEVMQKLDGELIEIDGNPKIQLEDGRIVYGCQVWWQFDNAPVPERRIVDETGEVLD